MPVAGPVLGGGRRRGTGGSFGQRMVAAAGLEAARAAAQAARGRCKLLTLVLVLEPAARRLLLGRKKRGFGEGYW